MSFDDIIVSPWQCLITSPEWRRQEFGLMLWTKSCPRRQLDTERHIKRSVPVARPTSHWTPSSWRSSGGRGPRWWTSSSHRRRRWRLAAASSAGCRWGRTRCGRAGSARRREPRSTRDPRSQQDHLRHGRQNAITSPSPHSPLSLSILSSQFCSSLMSQPGPYHPLSHRHSQLCL